MKNLVLLSSTLAMLLTGCGSSSDGANSALSTLSSNLSAPIIINTPGKTKASQETNQTVDQNQSTPKSPLGAPSNLKIETISKNKIKLSWQDNSTKEKAFCIYKDGEHIATVEANNTSVEIGCLKSGEIHTFSIKAINDDGASEAVSIEGGINQHNQHKQNKEIKIIGSFDENSSAGIVAISSDGTKAFVTDYNNGLKIFDVSNIKNPKQIGSYDIYPTDIALSGDGKKAYVADDGNGLLILDISDPSNIKKISSLLDAKSDDSYLEGMIVTVSDDESRAIIKEYHRPMMVDISDPTKMKLLGYVGNYGTTKIYLSHDKTKVYATDEFSGLIVYDISDQTQAKELTKLKLDTIEYPYQLIVTGDESLAFLADAYNRKIAVVDISNPNDLKLINTYETEDYVYDIKLSSDKTKAFLAELDDGLVIIDISDPKNIKKIKTIDTKGAYNVTISKDENKAYVSNKEGAVIIVDISALH
ncbi:MAG: hypothetical protein DSZ06_02850 [Sulfurospirillum sp.]|nr:MAG: hypothetical protein DSZ06_02850 [Sulfurospirillum sp.]